jgi:6 kDa early secretory antigenic target
MSDDLIKVNFGAISNLASQVDSQVQQIEGQLETLKSAIQKLAMTWEGGTQEAFQQVQTNWNQSADDLNQVLAKIGTAVHAAQESYQETESRNAQSWT